MKLLQRLRSLSHHPALLGNCLLCHQPVQSRPLLCNECQAALPRIEHPCPCCAFPLLDEEALCGSCLQHPPLWDRLRVFADYETPYRQLIHRLKYAHHPECATLLGRLFSEGICCDHKPEALLPVPLHWWRQWRRGYNQAAMLANEMGRIMNIPIDHDCLRRVRATSAQAKLDKAQRQKNLQNAFSIQPLPYRHVAIIDDVVTTGATAEQITTALRQAGAERVEVWAICRTLRHAS